MKRLLFLLMPLVAMTQQVQNRTGIAGSWRATTVVSDGSSDGAIRDFFLELKADGTSVTGTVTGAPIVIREGRVEGTAVTLTGVIDNQPVSFTGNLSGDEIVFRAVGLTPEPFHLVARRVARVTTTTITGSVS